MKRFLAAFCLLLAAPALAAQEVPGRLTLDHALRIARVYNPTYRQALNTLDVSAAEERASWAAFLPSVSASMSFGGNRSRTVNAVGNFDEPLERPDVVDATRSSASQGIGLQMTLFDGAQNVNRLRSSRASGRAAAARADRAWLQLEADVTRRYYEAVRAQNRIRLEDRLLAYRRDQLQVTERQLRVAASTPVDVLGAQVDLAGQELAVEQARGEARKQLLLLLEAMGVDGDAEFEPADDLAPVFDPAALDVEALVAGATAGSPRVLELEADLAAARSGLGAARGGRLPTISLSSSISRSTNRSEYDALFEMNPPNRSFSLGISAQYQLFSRLQTSQRIVQAEVARSNAEHGLRAGRLQVEREVRSAFIDIGNAFRSVQLADRSAELSRMRLEMAREQYRLGARSFTELQQVANQAAESERRAVDARFTFASALVELEQRVGRRVRP